MLIELIYEWYISFGDSKETSVQVWFNRVAESVNSYIKLG